MRLVLGRIFSMLVTVGGWGLFGARVILDVIGYSTVREDAAVAAGLLEKFLSWLLSVPWEATLGFALLSTIALMWLSWPRNGAVTATTSTVPESSEGPLGISSSTVEELNATLNPPKEPHPVFGTPTQEVREHYLSWWHIPVELDRGGDDAGARIDLCTVQMQCAFESQHFPDPITMRWRSGDDPRGVEESTLLEGRTLMVPVAIRCEKNTVVAPEHMAISDGVPRFTGAAYLRDNNINQHQLTGGFVQFRLIVHAGVKNWISPPYILRYPATEHSNGQFILCLL